MPEGTLEWQSRWNGNRGVVFAATEKGEEVWATLMLGTVHIKRADIPAFVEQMRKGLDALEKLA